ncbi:MAG: mechanosensitive ion channel [Robiginitomaculum sp.]|nr:mechanosensitive ion channel [Robiginitomaculum sp.]
MAQQKNETTQNTESQKELEVEPLAAQPPETVPGTGEISAPQTGAAQTPPTEALAPAPQAAPGTIDTTPATDAGGFSFSGILDSAKEIASKISHQIWDWLTSPAFLVMVGVVILGYFLARYITKQLVKRVDFFREEPKDGKLLRVKKIAWQLRDLVFPAVLITLYAAASPALQSIPILGQDWLVKIAQGLAVVFLLYTAIKRFIKHPLVQKLVIWIAIPVAVLKVFGWFDEFQTFMQDDVKLELGNISIPAWTVANILIFGSILFWVGRISNTKGKEVIQKQESIDAGTREVFSKIFEMILFAILFVLLMNIAGIDLGALVVLGGAIGLGLGFGLQQIAANFISGMILLLDRTIKIGDYVVLPDGQEGYVQALNMRSATVETTDGKDIMVPNVTFIENAYENWTHSDPRQRYEVYFSVAYDTNIDMLEGILIPEISKHKSVLQEPEKPDLELREFGDFGIKFAIEFWCDGIDDGENKFTSDLNFIVWRTLKKHGIEMPLPQREVRILKD